MNGSKGKSKTVKKSDKFSRICFCTPEGTACLLAESRSLYILIRHGVTDWNAEMRLQGREDIPLNNEGLLQAEKCAGELASSLDGIERNICLYSSPLSRAVDTANSISDALGKGGVTVCDDLIERDYADITGLTVEQKKKIGKHLYDNNGIESIKDAAERMKKALGKIRNDTSDGGIVIAVTHGGIINALFSYLTGKRAGTRAAIAANCTYSLVAVGNRDVIPIGFNLDKDTLDRYLEYFKN